MRSIIVALLPLAWLAACAYPVVPAEAGGTAPQPAVQRSGAEARNEEAAAARAAPAEQAGTPAPQFDSDEINQVLRLVASEDAGRCAQSYDSIELIGHGIDELGSAMLATEGLQTKAQRARNAPMKMSLHRASECLGKALRLAPDDYVARLALGVTYLMLAKSEYKFDDKRGGTGQWVPDANWAMYVAAAKQQLGYAYMLRAGQYEPLYYLAEIAAEEGDFAKAREFLQPLQQEGYKLGPVLALQGFMAEWEGNPDQAQQFYQQALQSGWPLRTFTFVQGRLWERQRELEGATR